MDIDMDKECVNLCKTLNKLQGIKTVSSCCGHGKNEFLIWFRADSLENLPRLLYWFDSCHCGFYHWRIIAKTDCGMSPVSFMIEGPVGAYNEAEEIAKLID